MESNIVQILDQIKDKRVRVQIILEYIKQYAASLENCKQCSTVAMIPANPVRIWERSEEIKVELAQLEYLILKEFEK